MYIALLLLTPVVCEWVEISQHHYIRKPSLMHHTHTEDTETYEETVPGPFQSPFKKTHRPLYSTIKNIVTEAYEEDTTSFKKPVRTQYFPEDGFTEIYVEDGPGSTPRYRFRKPVRNHFPVTDHVSEEYVEATTSPYRRPTHTHFSVDRVDDDEGKFVKRNRIYLNQSITESDAWNKGNVNKVPKHGNVQRVKLESNAVKAPNIKDDPVKTSVSSSSSQINNKNDIGDVTDLSEIVTNTEEMLHDVYTSRRKLNRNKIQAEIVGENFKQLDFQGTITTLQDYKNIANRHKDNLTIGTQFIHNNHNLLFVTNRDGLVNDKSSIQKFDIKYDTKTPNVNSPIKTAIFIENNQIPKFTVDINSISKNEPIRKIPAMNNVNKAINKMPHDFVTQTKEPFEEDYATVSDDNDGPIVGNSRKIVNKLLDESKLDLGAEEESSKEPSNDYKANTIENLMTLMKVVADTIRRNTRRSVNSKTRYLKNLKDTILSTIKERIDATWPDDPPASQTHPRAARAAQASARGHIEIPSSESALMTISFLTFAVFLIKLVLQIIQAYKNKTMMVTPAVVATVGRVVAASKRSTTP